MQQAEYNAKVQDMQRFCLSANLQFRVRPDYAESVINPPELAVARFEVFYGDWRELGYQSKPMHPDASYNYDDIEDMKVRAEVARDLSQ